tara:strand:+ start:3096 stop:3779 length:684 start_codon:yes stop_codon:yes gene_type:complete
MTKSRLIYNTIMMLVAMIIIPVFWILNANNQFSGILPTLDNKPSPWPPIVGQPYPDLDLIDQEGQDFKLSYLKGKVIIIEPIGMNCPSCQAFSGGHDYGAYQNNPVEGYSKSFRKIFPYYAKGLQLPSNDIAFVQILLYDMKMDAPTKEDAQSWARHFHIKKDDNHFVTVFPYDMRSPASFKLIPGFQLIDRNFILRVDSTGHSPRHNLYKQLIPLTPKFVAQKAQQ